MKNNTEETIYIPFLLEHSGIVGVGDTESMG
jgi:hypothetical protein